MDEFKSFRSIERLDQPVVITEKIHGTNAQVFISEEGVVVAGSRNRYLSVGDDNFGFASWVKENEDGLRSNLGPGRFYGEWYGRGIGGGYGLSDRRLAMFTGEPTDLYGVVPTLYTGPFSNSAVEAALERLQTEGSVIAPGYMMAEGIVIYFVRTGVLMKKVLDPAVWAAKKVKTPKEKVDISQYEQYFQPERLEQILLKDESLTLGFPATIRDIASAYMADLLKDEVLEDNVKAIVGKEIFSFIKRQLSR